MHSFPNHSLHKPNDSRPRLPSPNAVCFVGCVSSESQLHRALSLATALLFSVSREEKQSIVHYTLMQIHSGRRLAGWIESENVPTPWALLAKPLMICEETNSEFFRFQDLEDAMDVTASALALSSRAWPHVAFSNTGLFLEVRRSPCWQNQFGRIQPKTLPL